MVSYVVLRSAQEISGAAKDHASHRVEVDQVLGEAALVQTGATLVHGGTSLVQRGGHLVHGEAVLVLWAWAF